MCPTVSPQGTGELVRNEGPWPRWLPGHPQQGTRTSAFLGSETPSHPIFPWLQESDLLVLCILLWIT